MCQLLQVYLKSNCLLLVAKEVLPFCQRHGVTDAEAYLLERLGDVTAALCIYVGRLEAATSGLVDAVLSGQLPPSELTGINVSKSASGLGFRSLLPPRRPGKRPALSLPLPSFTSPPLNFMDLLFSMRLLSL